MPRDSGGIWSDIPGITAVPGATIESADWNNYRADLRTNEFNAARPITAGGTGATNAVDALNNLGGVGVTNFLDAYAVGDFYETIRTLDANWLRRNGLLYNVASYPELAAILPSLPDGVQWSNVSLGAAGAESILAKPTGGYILASYSSSGGVFTTNIYNSSDGELWSIVATLPGSVAVIDLAYGGGVYLAADAQGKIFTSNDGIAWSAGATSIAGGTTPYTNSVTFGVGLFIATTGNTAGKYIYSSTDGTTWTLRHTVAGGSSAPQLSRVRYINANFIAIGTAGACVTSTNGTTWTARTTGTSEDLNGVTYGNLLYVIVGKVGTILTSTNLAAWTARTSGTTQALNDVLYSTAGFLAVGAGGTARISPATSGTTWASSATGTSQALTDAVFDPNQQNKYLVIQSGSTSLLKGIRTLPTQFQVPSDDPVYGWIRALPIVP